MQKVIIVVDDDLAILEVVSIVLSRRGYKLVALSRGEQLMDIVVTLKPALVILDVQLGNTDGRELCLQLKQNEITKDIPVVLFSADLANFTHANAYYADALLSKPFKIEELVKVAEEFAAIKN